MNSEASKKNWFSVTNILLFVIVAFAVCVQLSSGAKDDVDVDVKGNNNHKKFHALEVFFCWGVLPTLLVFFLPLLWLRSLASAST